MFPGFRRHDACYPVLAGSCFSSTAVVLPDLLSAVPAAALAPAEVSPVISDKSAAPPTPIAVVEEQPALLDVLNIATGDEASAAAATTERPMTPEQLTPQQLAPTVTDPFTAVADPFAPAAVSETAPADAAVPAVALATVEATQVSWCML